MNFAKRKRRWLQFSLRSVLLLTLGVALWLGYEVRQARRTEGHRRAIESLGGQVEIESRGVSLLRFVLGGDFGQQIVAAEILGQSVDDATNTLPSMPYLRRVRVVYDSTCDLHPAWDRLNTSLPGKTIEAVGDIEVGLGMEAPTMRRFVAKMNQGSAKVQQLSRDLEHVVFWYFYHVRQLVDGTVVELLLGKQIGISIPGTDTALAVLVMEDRAVDGALVKVNTRRGSQDLKLVDVDGDGIPEVGFEYNASKWWPLEDVRQIPGDPRYWLGLYKIEHDGFKSLLPEAKQSP